MKLFSLNRRRLVMAKIEIRGKHLTAGSNWCHGYLIYTNDAGTEYILRGGPEPVRLGGIPVDIIAGDIVFQGADTLLEYSKATNHLHKDWDDKGTHYRQQIVSGSEAKMRTLFDKARERARQLQGHDYEIFWQNSNSAITNVVEYAGMKVKWPSSAGFGGRQIEFPGADRPKFSEGELDKFGRFIRSQLSKLKIGKVTILNTPTQPGSKNEFSFVEDVLESDQGGVPLSSKNIVLTKEAAEFVVAPAFFTAYGVFIDKLFDTVDKKFSERQAKIFKETFYKKVPDGSDLFKQDDIMKKVRAGIKASLHEAGAGQNALDGTIDVGITEMNENAKILLSKVIAKAETVLANQSELLVKGIKVQSLRVDLTVQPGMEQLSEDEQRQRYLATIDIFTNIGRTAAGLASLIGHPEEAYYFSSLATGFSNIATGLVQLGTTTGIAMINPALAVMNGIMGLISLFSVRARRGQPDPHAIIIKQLGRLIDMVVELRHEMHGRFDRLEHILFSNHNDVITQLKKIRSDQSDLLRGITQIGDDVLKARVEMQSYFRSLEEQLEFGTLVKDMLWTYRDLFGNMPFSIVDKHALQKLREVGQIDPLTSVKRAFHTAYKRASLDAFKSTFVGNIHQLKDNLQLTNIEGNIQGLLEYYNNLRERVVLTHLPNPEIYERAVRAYLSLDRMVEGPIIERREHYEKMSKTGKSLSQFYELLRLDPEFFVHLIKQCEKHFENWVKEFHAIERQFIDEEFDELFVKKRDDISRRKEEVDRSPGSFYYSVFINCYRSWGCEHHRVPIHNVDPPCQAPFVGKEILKRYLVSVAQRTDGVKNKFSLFQPTSADLRLEEASFADLGVNPGIFMSNFSGQSHSYTWSTARDPREAPLYRDYAHLMPTTYFSDLNLTYHLAEFLGAGKIVYNFQSKEGIAQDGIFFQRKGLIREIPKDNFFWLPSVGSGNGKISRTRLVDAEIFASFVFTDQSPTLMISHKVRNDLQKWAETDVCRPGTNVPNTPLECGGYMLQYNVPSLISASGIIEPAPITSFVQQIEPEVSTRNEQIIKTKIDLRLAQEREKFARYFARSINLGTNIKDALETLNYHTVLLHAYIYLAYPELEQSLAYSLRKQMFPWAADRISEAIQGNTFLSHVEAIQGLFKSLRQVFSNYTQSLQADSGSSKLDFHLLLIQERITELSVEPESTQDECQERNDEDDVTVEIPDPSKTMPIFQVRRLLSIEEPEDEDEEAETLSSGVDASNAVDISDMEGTSAFIPPQVAEAVTSSALAKISTPFWAKPLRLARIVIGIPLVEVKTVKIGDLDLAGGLWGTVSSMTDYVVSGVVSRTWGTTPEASFTLPISNDQFYTGTSAPFDRWNRSTNHDPLTGVPVFQHQYTYQEKEVASTMLYSQPIPCVSEDGQRTNVLKATGLFAGREKGPFSDVCKELPPTFLEIGWKSGLSGAQMGALRGASNVIGGKNTWKSKIIFYNTYFLWSLYKLLAEDSQNGFNIALDKTAVNTRWLMGTEFALSLASFGLKYSGECLQQYQYTPCQIAGKLACKTSVMVGYLLYAYQAIHPIRSSPLPWLTFGQLAIQLFASVGGGFIAQHAIERISSFVGSTFLLYRQGNLKNSYENHDDTVLQYNELIMNKSFC